MFGKIIPLLLALAILPSFALGNTNTFYNYGPTNLMVHFTAGCMNNSAGIKTYCFQGYPDILVPANTPNNGANGGVVQTFNTTWSGNWYSYAQGTNVLPVGILCEVTYMPGVPTFYDVSTISADTEAPPLANYEDGVHFFFPKFGNSGDRISGCLTYPCPFCYSSTQPNGLDGSHTCSTDDTDLITYLGVGSPNP